MIKRVMKSDNIGNTFNALVATAFPGAKNISFEIIPGFSNCGTAYVDGVAYDYVDYGDYVNFVRAK